MSEKKRQERKDKQIPLAKSRAEAVDYDDSFSSNNKLLQDLQAPNLLINKKV